MDFIKIMVRSMSEYYTGVGSRKAPSKILKLAENISIKMSKKGFTLRSGGAIGADKAFEKYAVKKDIFYLYDSTQEAEDIVSKLHKSWRSVSHIARKLHGRNAFQVLGRDLKTPSKFLICWTKDGAISHKERSIATGGTGTAISVADIYGIPVFNLKREDHYRRITKWIER